MSKASDFYDELVEVERLHVGDKLTSVTKHNCDIRYTFENSGYSQWHLFIPINEHKLAILIKALELCNKDRIKWVERTRGLVGISNINTWLKKAEETIKSTTEWKVTDESVNWPEWLLEQEKEQNEYKKRDS